MTHSFALCVDVGMRWDVGKGKIDRVDATIEGSEPNLATPNVANDFPASIVEQLV